MIGWLGTRIEHALRSLGLLPKKGTIPAPLDLLRHSEIPILTTQHTVFVALLIAECLGKLGVTSRIIHGKPPEGYSDAPHFVLAPQIFDELPPRYIAFQMEQSVSNRWFNRRYFRILSRALAVLDYSIDNIAFLRSWGLSIKQIYFLPLACLRGFSAAERQPSGPPIDVLFYGDPTSARRAEMLEELGRHFSVEIASEVFGDDLYDRIARARVVVNIHYYDNALLETTRIFECLSLNKLVVSEKGTDQQRHAGLDELVEFVDIGDTAAMVKAIGKALTDQPYRDSRLAAVRDASAKGSTPFQFFFLRFLLAHGAIDFDRFYALAGPCVDFRGDHVCLGLPEYRERHDQFLRSSPPGFELFPGLRHHLGWVGCGLSYKFIMRKAQEQGLPRIVVCEDDVEFPPGWDRRFRKILKFLERHDDWDIFAGLIADLHQDVRVLRVENVSGDDLAYIDRMVSTVFNVYNSNVFQVIAAWDPTHLDFEENTVDRYIENHGKLRIVATQPYLVGHREDLKSTIWDFGNSEYNSMIDRSSAELRNRIDLFKSTQQAEPFGNG